MTHDPLCPFSRECIGGEHEPFAVGPLTCSNTECLAICDCDLIAKVRSDTLDKARCAVSDVFWPTNGTWVSGKTTFDNLGRACLHAIDGLRGE